MYGDERKKKGIIFDEDSLIAASCDDEALVFLCELMSLKRTFKSCNPTGM